MEKRKSRSIPLMDYYEILQLEYLSYYFRYYYYQRKVDKDKYIDFCNKKRDSIEKLALRNCFKSMFADPQTCEKYVNKFFRGQGMPALAYRDEHQHKHLGYWDKHYFLKSDDVFAVYNGEECIVKANLCKFDEDYDFIILELPSGMTAKVEISEVEFHDQIFESSIYESIF